MYSCEMKIHQTLLYYYKVYLFLTLYIRSASVVIEKLRSEVRIFILVGPHGLRSHVIISYYCQVRNNDENLSQTGYSGALWRFVYYYFYLDTSTITVNEYQNNVLFENVKRINIIEIIIQARQENMVKTIKRKLLFLGNARDCGSASNKQV